MIINSDPNYTPPTISDEGWKEMYGAKVTPMLRQLEWIKDDACPVLQSRTVDEEHGKVSDETEVTFIYKGVANGKTKALLLGTLATPFRVFYVADDKAFAVVKSQLMKNEGFLDYQITEIGTTLTDNKADAIYAWQDNFFSLAKHSAKIAARSKYSHTQAAKQTEGTRAVVLNEREATNLIKEIATKYGIKNLDLQFGPLRNNVLGYVTSLDDATTPMALPFGVKLWYNDSVIYKHSVIHECAHAIEMFRNGLTAHGKGFRDIYRVLLKAYMDLDPVGL